MYCCIGLQAYCLKIKEMDDMEINAAVSGQSLVYGQSRTQLI